MSVHKKAVEFLYSKPIFNDRRSNGKEDPIIKPHIYGFIRHSDQFVTERSMKLTSFC